MADDNKDLITIHSVPDFLKEIYRLEKFDGVRCYRGESNVKWPLKPSVMRDLRPDAEKNIINELTLEASPDFIGDTSMFEKLVRAQHYGLPTRLLDVSLNPLVALFFACSDESQMDEDGSVLIMDFKADRVKFAGSDAVSLLSNLSQLSDGEKEKIDNCISKCIQGGLKVPDAIKALNKLKEVDQLCQFVRREKSYFRKEVHPHDFRRYYFVHPHKNNRRVAAQSGAFVIAGLLEYRKIESNHSFKLGKILVASGSKASIKNELEQINITSRTMFPEIEFAARHIKGKWKKGGNPDGDLSDLLGDIFG